VLAVFGETFVVMLQVEEEEVAVAVAVRAWCATG
jgi:hypothetical protein